MPELGRSALAATAHTLCHTLIVPRADPCIPCGALRSMRQVVLVHTCAPAYSVGCPPLRANTGYSYRNTQGWRAASKSVQPAHRNRSVCAVMSRLAAVTAVLWTSAPCRFTYSQCSLSTNGVCARLSRHVKLDTICIACARVPSQRPQGGELTIRHWPVVVQGVLNQELPHVVGVVTQLLQVLGQRSGRVEALLEPLGVAACSQAGGMGRPKPRARASGTLVLCYGVCIGHQQASNSSQQLVL